MESKIKNFLIEKNKINKNKELLETKWTSKCNKKQRSNPKLWPLKHSKGWQMKLYRNHLKFGTMGEAQNFRIQKNEKHRIMENNRISFLKKKKKRNVLASKLRPVKDFK